MSNQFSTVRVVDYRKPDGSVRPNGVPPKEAQVLPIDSSQDRYIEIVCRHCKGTTFCDCVQCGGGPGGKGICIPCEGRGYYKEEIKKPSQTHPDPKTQAWLDRLQWDEANPELLKLMPTLEQTIQKFRWRRPPAIDDKHKLFVDKTYRGTDTFCALITLGVQHGDETTAAVLRLIGNGPLEIVGYGVSEIFDIQTAPRGFQTYEFINRHDSEVTIKVYAHGRTKMMGKFTL